MKSSALKCLTCERQPAVQHYNGLVPVAVLCRSCGNHYRLTPVIPNAEPQSVQAPAASA